MSLWRRIRHLARRDGFEQQFDEELRFHLDQLAEDFERSGMPPAKARLAARRRLGNQGQIAEASREQWLARWWQTLAQDVRYGLRQLRRNPGFTAVAIAILALGIGANSAIFSVIDQAMLRPLAYREPARITTVHVLGGQQGRDRFPWSYPKFVRMQESARSFEAVAAYSASSMNLSEPGDPERIRVEFVTGDYFAILGIPPLVGRTLTPTDDGSDAAGTIVLSQQLWQRRFAADPGIVGRRVVLKGQPVTVVGIMPPRLRAMSGNVDAWVPAALAPGLEYTEILTEAGNHWLAAIGRLRDGVTIEQARAEVAVIGGRINDEFRFSEEAAAWSATTDPLADTRLEPAARQSLVVIGIAVGLVLLIACANLASLLLVRATARRREIAVRLTIGAGRARLLAQLLTESLLLATLGGAAGLGLAWITIPLLTRLSPAAGSGPGGQAYLFDPATVAIDARVLAFGAAPTLVTGVLVGLSPAWFATRSDLRSMLHAGQTHPGGTGFWHRLGAYRVLAAAEVALSLVLLVGAGLALRSFAALTAIDAGFDGHGVLTFRLSPSENDFAGRDPAGFKSQLVDRLTGLPGVTAAGVNLCAPLTGPCSASIVSRWRPEQTGNGTPGPGIGVHYVTPGYFAALDIPVIRGRNFESGDRRGSPRVVLLNETAARALWPGEDPIGRRLAIATSYFHGGDSTAEVIGIVGDVKYGRREDVQGPDAYIPALQVRFAGTSVFVRTDGNPMALLPAVRRELKTLDPGLPLYGARAMDEVAAQATAGARFGAVILAIFAATALLLAVVGLYGVMAYSVAQRTREMGIRMALGADRSAVLRLVVRDGTLITVAGLAAGLAGTLVFARVLQATLYGVSATDPAFLAAVTAVLGAAALLASYLPARRATRVDPARSLRSE